MFFLGFAGSFLPYLLFFGVLLFLTIGNKVQDRQLAALEEKRIETPDAAYQQDIISENDFYFFKTDEIQSGQDNYKSAVQMEFQLSAARFLSEKIACPPGEKYKFQVTYNYYGLSPPCMIS